MRSDFGIFKCVVIATLLASSLPTLATAKLTLDYRMTSSAALCQAQNTITNCTAAGPGLYCDSCDVLVACKRTGAGVLEKEQVKRCDSGEKCVNGACGNTQSPICDGSACLDFACKHAGVFPDPFFCNRYVMCVNTQTAAQPVLKGYLQTCNEGYGYDIATGICKTKLTNGQCPSGQYPVPLCTTAGQTGALPENKSIFYICEQYNALIKVLYPVLDICPNGQIYNDNFQCADAIIPM